MHSQGGLSEFGVKERLTQFGFSQWERLTGRQKSYAKRAWSVLTYKWRWQIAMNVPYLAIFVLDRTIPAVHRFDMAILATVASRLPLPTFVSSLIGVG